MVSGQSTLRGLQQQWAQHSARVRKRMVLDMWRCQAGQWRDAASCWLQILLRRLVCSCHRVVGWGSSTYRGWSQGAGLGLGRRRWWSLQEALKQSLVLPVPSLLAEGRVWLGQADVSSVPSSETLP